MKRNILVLITLLFTSCIYDKVDNRKLIIQNKAKNKIYCFISQSNNFGESYLLKDKTLLEDYSIDPGKTSRIFKSPRHWDEEISLSIEGKIRLFIIEYDTIEKYGWEKVFNKAIYTELMKFDLKDLDSCKWQITYDGK